MQRRRVIRTGEGHGPTNKLRGRLTDILSSPILVPRRHRPQLLNSQLVYTSGKRNDVALFLHANTHTTPRLMSSDHRWPFAVPTWRARPNKASPGKHSQKPFLMWRLLSNYATKELYDCAIVNYSTIGTILVRGDSQSSYGPTTIFYPFIWSSRPVDRPLSAFLFGSGRVTRNSFLGTIVALSVLYNVVPKGHRPFCIPP
jgi:hypothetical protein